jgi:hypothetical protein
VELDHNTVIFQKVNSQRNKNFSGSFQPDQEKACNICPFLYNTNMSYYKLCGIGSQHSNISKGKRRVHIKITGMQDSNQGRQK